jgi:hypothetical protein
MLVGALAVVGVAVAGCSSAAPPPAAAPTPAPSATPAEQGVRGQITAETATTWTVTTAKGKAFTVTLGPQTVFGTKTAPATAGAVPRRHHGAGYRAAQRRDGDRHPRGAREGQARADRADRRARHPRPPECRRAATRTGGAAARRVSRIRVGRPPRASAVPADRPILGHPRVTGATSVGDDATTEVPMKALVYHGPGNKAWEDVPDATVQDPTDVVVRVRRRRSAAPTCTSCRATSPP